VDHARFDLRVSRPSRGKSGIDARDKMHGEDAVRRRWGAIATGKPPISS
jgi:hypothetical protein